MSNWQLIDPAAKRQRRETEDSTGLQIPMASESPVSSPLARSSIINSDDANEAFTDQHQSNENSATGSVES